MLRFDLHLGDLDGPWSCKTTVWRSGMSYVEPFTHPALTVEHMTTRTETVFRVTEKRPEGDHLVLTFSRDGDAPVVVTAGPGGVAPTYLASDGDRVVGSWDIVDLVEFASPDRISAVEVTRLLTRRHRYGHQSVFTSITRLSAGSRATWTRGAGMTMTYPAAVAHPRPRSLQAGADPVAHFAALLDRVVDEAGDTEPNTAAYLHTDDDLAGLLRTARVHTRSGALLVLATLTVVPLVPEHPRQVEVTTRHGTAGVEISTTWDPARKLVTTDRSWHFPDRTEHDHFTRRVWSSHELRDHARAAGFDVLEPDDVDGVSLVARRA